MRPTPLVVSLAAAIVAACSSVPAPGPAIPRPAPTALHAETSERVAVKGFIRAKYLKNKPWHHRHAEDIEGKLDVHWDHVLEGACIKPVPTESGCYDDGIGGPAQLPAVRGERLVTGG